MKNKDIREYAKRHGVKLWQMRDSSVIHTMEVCRKGEYNEYKYNSRQDNE